MQNKYKKTKNTYVVIAVVKTVTAIAPMLIIYYVNLSVYLDIE